MDRDWPAAKFMQKPVKLAELGERIADLLARGRAARRRKGA